MAYGNPLGDLDVVFDDDVPAEFGCRMNYGAV